MNETGSGASGSSNSGYRYRHANLDCAHDYLLPRLRDILKRRLSAGQRIFDLGCGNGAVANELAAGGYEVEGVDPSNEGIEQANRRYPHLRIEVGIAYDPLVERFGTFDAVVSLEVVEHVYAPRDYARTLHDLIAPGGIAVVSTPYHGYWKNLALALTGKFDAHWSPLWDHGHIKFWSVRSIRLLLSEAGLKVLEVHRVGRVPALAKSMIIIAEKPS